MPRVKMHNDLCHDYYRDFEKQIRGKVLAFLVSGDTDPFHDGPGLSQDSIGFI